MTNIWTNSRHLVSVLRFSTGGGLGFRGLERGWARWYINGIEYLSQWLVVSLSVFKLMTKGGGKRVEDTVRIGSNPLHRYDTEDIG